jgi:predicted  nucleic acid-binding Zn-ribbon protein
MNLSSMSWIAGTAVLAVLGLRAPVSGQTASPSNQDTLAALLVEVRGLRAAMEQMASAAPRMQLAFGRLQMQEQRVSTVVRRADVLHDAVVTAQNRVRDLQDLVANMQRDLDNNAVAPERRSEMEGNVAARKQDLIRATADSQRLQTEELDAGNQIANEQARWAEINQRLEELERALAR